MAWPEVAEADRGMVVVIPTGSCEQHGAHLPLFTDSILATASAEAVERNLPHEVLLTPTVWLGASGHHLAFDGTLSTSCAAFGESVVAIIRSLARHGFTKFFVVNGHGGNISPLDVALRELRLQDPRLQLATAGYYQFAESTCREVLEGQTSIRHACEAETSLMMHVAPDLVRRDKIVDDGLEPNVVGIVAHFDERTERGSLGKATLATPEKGKAIFEAAVAGLVQNVQAFHKGLEFRG